MANTTKEATLLMDRKGKGLLSVQQALVADAVVAHDVNATFSDTEVEAALNALGVKINAILDILEAHNLMSAS